MAVPTATPASTPSPQLVGKAFVDQFYHILHQSPESVHKFYHDSSTLSRPNSNGDMISVTTMQAINDLVLSLDSKSYVTEIQTADSQPSYKDGVFILVTGILTGTEDNFRRRFTQSFFLAPQDKGAYFVLNDVFSFVGESQPREIDQMLVNGSKNDVPEAPLNPQHDLVQDHQVLDSTTPPSEGDLENFDGIGNPSENGDSVIEEEVAVEQPTRPSQIDVQPSSEMMTSVTQEDVPKQSYAAVVSAHMPTTKSRPSPFRPEKPSVATTAPATLPEAPVTNSSIALGSNDLSDVEGHSIYIRNLPLNATASQVEEEFKIFGTIMSGGVQVRSNKIEHFCFGFVEFESLSSMQAAIKASPITIGGRQAYVEEKRTPNRVRNGVTTTGSGSGGRGQYSSGRGGYRHDIFRGRGGFGGNQGYGRSEFRHRSEYSNGGEYSNRGPGSAGREGYQPRVVQSGNGRTGQRSSGMK